MAPSSINDAKNNLLRLIADALAGDDVVIAWGSVPLVRLVPVEASGRRDYGALKGKITLDESSGDALPADELDGWNLP